MRQPCHDCLGDATHEYNGIQYCDNCAPYEREDDDLIDEGDNDE